jgi:phosphoribosylamine--glycine ligase
MKFLVVGSGAREHAIVWKLTGERNVHEVICVPGNAGISRMARCLAADPGDPSALADLVERERVAVTVIGPELPLSRGVADLFASRRYAIVGPTQQAAALESSKAFAKEFMTRHRVPTARYRVCDSVDTARSAIARGEFGYPVVIKADGLAAGKGVVIAEDRATAESAIIDAMVERRFGGAGDRIVVEEFLDGQEASYFVLTDGKSMIALASAQDHKRAYDGDKGPNTGGMGAFAPSPLVTAEVERRVAAEIVEPVLEGMSNEGYPFQGFLYVGLMLTADGPKVVEFNVRLGDPEAQVVLPMLDEDLGSLLAQIAIGPLSSRPARLRREANVGVVLASGGYPGAFQSGHVIEGLDDAEMMPPALVFHAGTARRGRDIVSAGGRVLTVVGRGSTHRDAIDVAYDAVSRIRFEGMQYRRDIGVKALAT